MSKERKMQLKRVAAVAMVAAGLLLAEWLLEQWYLTNKEER